MTDSDDYSGDSAPIYAAADPFVLAREHAAGQHVIIRHVGCPTCALMAEADRKAGRDRPIRLGLPPELR